MVLRLGINEWPMPGRLVNKKTYVQEYHELTEKTGIPFVPDAAWKDAVFAAAIMLAIMACAFWFGPFGPTGQPDPTIIQTAPKPDFAFLWIYAVLAYLPPSLETPVLFIAPVVVIVRHAAAAAGLWRRRKALVAPPGCCAYGCGHRGHPRRIYSSWHLHAVEPGDERLDQRSNPRQADLKDRTPLERRRRARPAEQAMPQLPLHRRSGWPARPCTRLSRFAHDRRPDHSPGPAGRRQHACLRQRAQSLPRRPPSCISCSPCAAAICSPAIDASRKMAAYQRAHLQSAQPRSRRAPRLAFTLYSMPPASQAIFAEWSPPLFLTTMVLLCAIVYTRGWFAIRKTRPRAVLRMAPGSVPARPRHSLARYRFAHGRLCRRASERAHGRASATDVLRPAAPASRLSAGAAAARPASRRAPSACSALCSA